MPDQTAQRRRQAASFASRKLARREQYRTGQWHFGPSTPCGLPFKTTNPARIKVSIETDQDDIRSATINCEFSVESDTGRLLPFTTSNVDRIHNRIISQRRKAQNSLANMEAEKRELEAWVNSPGLKPLWEVKRGQRAVVELNAAIPAATQALSVLDVQLRAVEELVELAKSLNGAKLNVVETKVI